VVHHAAPKKEIKDSFQPTNRNVPQADIQQPEVAKTVTRPDSTIAKDLIRLPDNINTNQSIAFVNTSTLIKDDTELMSLITEVY
jgi:hypothetical protein